MRFFGLIGIIPIISYILRTAESKQIFPHLNLNNYDFVDTTLVIMCMYLYAFCQDFQHLKFRNMSLVKTDFAIWSCLITNDYYYLNECEINLNDHFMTTIFFLSHH